jgi:hypothetical protein
MFSDMCFFESIQQFEEVLEKVLRKSTRGFELCADMRGKPDVILIPQ